MPETDPAPGAEAVPVDETAEAYTAAQKRDALKAGQAMKNASGKPAYTIKNKADLRRAIKAIGRGGADHDAIRRHVIDRAKALNLSAMIPDNWKADGSLAETDASTRFGEIRECYDDMASRGAGFAIDAYNGPVSLTLRAPSLDPSSLRAVAGAAMDAALNALGALDPDFDADIDVPGAPAEDTDDDLEADGALDDPEAATSDDDVEDYAPGSGCPCGCGCAVPDEMVGGTGCPCTCGCQVCGAPMTVNAESTDTPPTGGEVAAAETVLVGETGPELFIPAAPGHVTPAAAIPAPDPVAETGADPAPEPAPIPPIEEPAVSETTPAAEAATTTPTIPAPTAAPVIQLTQEQFAELLGAVRAPVAETAPVPVPVVAEAPVIPAAAPAPVAPAPAPVQAAETATGTALAETVADAVNKALVAAIPALRDSIVSQYGLPPRQGIRTSETDRSQPTKAEDLWENRADLLLGNLGK